MTAGGGRSQPAMAGWGVSRGSTLAAARLELRDTAAREVRPGTGGCAAREAVWETRPDQAAGRPRPAGTPEETSDGGATGDNGVGVNAARRNARARRLQAASAERRPPRPP